VARKSKYTDEDKGAVLRSLTLNDGNITRTARELNIPKGTVQTWKAEWERHGASEEIVVAASEQAEQFIADATRARDTALSKWEEKVNNDEVAARDLMTGVGVLTDKLNLAKGLDRKNSDKPALDNAALREIARGVVEGAVSSALRREEEIVEAEYEEVETPVLKRGTS
jgi:transposase-like protein